MSQKTKRILAGDYTHNPEDYVHCYVCNVNFNKSKFRKQYYGQSVCAWCYGRNGKALVLLKLFVNMLASLPCETDDGNDTGPVDGCKCPPCGAKTVLIRMGTLVPHDLSHRQ